MVNSLEFFWVSLLVLGLLLSLFGESISLPVDILNEFGVMFIWSELIISLDVLLGWKFTVELGKINSLVSRVLWSIGLSSLLLGKSGGLDSVLGSFLFSHLSGLLFGDFSVLFDFHLVLDLNGLFVNLIVPLLGVMVVVSGWRLVKSHVFGIILVWHHTRLADLNRHFVFFGLLLHDMLNLISLLLGSNILHILNK